MFPSQKDYGTWAIGALVALGAIIFLMAVKRQYDHRKYMENFRQANQRIQDQRQQSMQQAARASKTSASQKKKVAQRPKIQAYEKSKNPLQHTLTPMDQFRQKIEQKSQQELKAFQKTVFLKFQSPQNMQFHQLDLFDGMAALYGSNHVTKTTALALAYPKMADKEQASQFLKEQWEHFPGLKGAKVQGFQPPQDLPSPGKESGLGGGTLWSGKLSDSRDIHAVMLPRADKKGTYMFIYTGPADFFEKTDFEDDYLKLQAEPAP